MIELLKSGLLGSGSKPIWSNNLLAMGSGLSQFTKKDKTGDDLTKKGKQDDIRINTHQNEVYMWAAKLGVSKQGLVHAIEMCGSNLVVHVRTWLLGMGYIK